MQFLRTQKCCLLCKHWNGAIGSTTIGIVRGGMLFTADNSEKHSCFKKGSGIETLVPASISSKGMKIDGGTPFFLGPVSADERNLFILFYSAL